MHARAGDRAARIKVVGSVAGTPPYRGVLRHRGWEASAPRPAAAARHRPAPSSRPPKSKSPDDRMAAPSRFVVGIDLGTTNCALAWVDTAARTTAPSIHLQDIPQLVNPGRDRRAPLLPSFLYLPGEQRLPCRQHGAAMGPAPTQRGRRGRATARRREPVAAGAPARSPGCRTAARTARRRSCRGARRRRCRSISPVDASAALPAAARRGVRSARSPAASRAGARAAGRAADRAGVVRRGGARADARGGRGAPGSSTSRCSRSRRPRSTPGSTRSATAGAGGSRSAISILVCDVGGGTTDFSLIAVAERDGDLALERVAVGEHILLGGDNMDLALARLLQQRLEARGPQGRHLAAARPVASVRGWPRKRCSRDPVAARAAGHAARPRLEADRRHDHDDADAATT